MANPSSNRQRFEGQLKELTSDINVLSERLQSRPHSHPSNVSGEEDVSSGSRGGGAVNDSEEIRVKTVHGQSATGRGGKPRSLGSSGSSSMSGDGPGEDAHRIIAERDALQSKCHKLERVITDLRHELSEMEHTKMELTHLKRDHATLTTSLETSERIRQQQKALITMLQGNSNSKADTNSLDRDGGDASNSVTPSVVAENRVWLNSALSSNKGTSSVVSGLSETDTDGESRGSRKGRKRGSRNVANQSRSANSNSRNSGGVALNNSRRGGGEKFLTGTIAVGIGGTMGANGVSNRKPALPRGKPIRARSRSGSGSVGGGSSNSKGNGAMLRTKSAPSAQDQGTRPRKSSGSSAATTGEDSQVDSLLLSSSAASRQKEYAMRLAYGVRGSSVGPATPSRRNTTDTALTDAAVVYLTTNKASPARVVGTPLRGSARGATVSASPARRVPSSPRCTFGSGHK